MDDDRKTIRESKRQIEQAKEEAIMKENAQRLYKELVQEISNEIAGSKCWLLMVLL